MMMHRPGTSRRRFLTGAIAAAVVARHVKPARARSAALRDAAQRSGLFWGAAVQSYQVNPETDLAQALARECSVIVPEWEMKWGAVEPARGQRNFRHCDVLMRFAAKHGLRCRGHALIWHRSIPAWAREVLSSEKSGWPRVEAHMSAMLGRYQDGAFLHWDVLNEVIEPKDGGDDGLRASPFLRAFGPDYIPRALFVAHDRMPKVPLYVNEYGLDYDGTTERDRRVALLRLIERLKTSNTPLHGIGIQAHLRLDESPFSERALRRFLAEIAAHGLKITLTELDVREREVSLPIEERDRRVAREVTRYLDVVLDEPAVEGVVTWGLSDRHSWLNAKLLQSGTRNRGLPLDETLAAKPVTYAMIEAMERRASR
jgi:endo-1,4-beta-xylanase